jgi:hypothetical protein
MRPRDKRGGAGLKPGFWKGDWLLGRAVVVATQVDAVL